MIQIKYILFPFLIWLCLAVIYTHNRKFILKSIFKPLIFEKYTSKDDETETDPDEETKDDETDSDEETKDNETDSDEETKYNETYSDKKSNDYEK